MIEQKMTTYKRSIAGGIVTMWMTISVLFVFGLLLTPLLIGIPLLLMAVIAVFISPWLVRAFVIGPCPFCGNEVTGLKTQKALTCRYCKHRILIKPEGFLLV